MEINVSKTKWLMLALLPLVAVAGCFCQAYPLPGECDCPTDARALYLGCGEEAVRRCPCGPDRQYYGLKPTCWRRWPAGWGCGTGGCGMACDAPAVDSPCVAPHSEEFDSSNPFRSDDEKPNQAPPAEATLPRVTPAVNVSRIETKRESVPTKKQAHETGPAEEIINKTALVKEPAPQVAPPSQTPPQSTSVKKEEKPALSERVEQHLFNNLEL